LQNPNLAALFKRYGAKGYGLHWYILERLYDAEGNMLKYDKEFIKELSKATQLSKIKVNMILSDMEALRLIGFRGDMMYSDRVDSEISAVLKSKNKNRDVS
jgi:hypothetical protein